MYRVQFGSQVVECEDIDDLTNLICIAERVTFKTFSYPDGFDKPAVYIDQPRIITITMPI